jgi:hypothetical protein
MTPHPPNKRYIHRPWADFEHGETLTGTICTPPRPSKSGTFFMGEVEHAAGECRCGCPPGKRTGFNINVMVKEVMTLPVGTRIQIRVLGQKYTNTGKPMWNLAMLVDHASVQP